MSPASLLLYSPGRTTAYELFEARAAGGGGVRSVLTGARHSPGANRRELVTSIVWPGIRSHMLTGLRLSVGLAWIILVPAEMLGVDSGLGYLILVIGLCGCALDLAARWLFQPRRRTSGRISANAGNREATAQASYAPAATE